MKDNDFGGGARGRDYPSSMDAKGAGGRGSGRRLRSGSGFVIALIAGGVSLLLAAGAYLAGLGLGAAIVIYLLGSPLLALGLGLLLLRPREDENSGAKVSEPQRCPRMLLL
ncbi:hypothetical protein SAMN06297129_1408 [Pseudooceanicola antarcticus]|uniref:Uncharacterized protein n=2 Tax=Pseudooceanicola antarcticus TaxID=1247613 RepID=A0A285IK41_9RHOB|nr:hypothetical protein [Pseudooceanicola antarcticus]SNY48345.1 hypothetical protein SAMN06297129_1408 [Pseudooceanicola antarcticus]